MEGKPLYRQRRVKLFAPLGIDELVVCSSYDSDARDRRSDGCETLVRDFVVPMIDDEFVGR
jgi:hypothetical protein